MTVLSIGLLYGAATLVVMLIGMPISFALGAVAIVFMIAFMPAGSVDTITQNVYEEMASITLLSIPLFILKGAAIGRSPRRQGSLRRAPRLAAQISRRPGHCQCVRLRVVCRDGRLFARHVLGHRLCRHSRDAQAWLLGQFRCRHHCRRRHARHPAAAVDHDDPLCRGRRAIARAGCFSRRSARPCFLSCCSPAMPPGTTVGNTALPKHSMRGPE